MSPPNSWSGGSSLPAPTQLLSISRIGVISREAAGNPSPGVGAGADGCSWAEVPWAAVMDGGAGRKWLLWTAAGQTLMDVPGEQGCREDCRD